MVNKRFLASFVILVLVLSLSFAFFYFRNSRNTHLEGKKAPVPQVELNGKSMSVQSYKYESFCWNQKCSQMKHKVPPLPITNVHGDDMIYMEWRNFKNKPNQVILHNLTTGEKITYHQSDSDIELDIPRQAKPFQYEVIFKWYNGSSSDLIGESFLSFKVNAQ